MDRDHALFGFLYFDLAWYVAFKRGYEKAVWTLLNLSDLDILGPSEILPLLSMLYVKFFRHVADWCWIRLLLWTAVVIFAILKVNIFEGLLGIEFKSEVWVLVFDDTLVIGENHGWGSEQVGFVGDFVDKGRWWKASFLEVEGPVFATVRYLFDHWDLVWFEFF